jgi:hypothetical protein
MSGIKISLLPNLTTPVLSGVTAVVQSGVTYNVTLSDLKDLLKVYLTGVTFSGNTLTIGDSIGNSISEEILNFDEINSNSITGGTFYGDGSKLSGINKYWFTNDNKIVNTGETLVISENLILENSTLSIDGTNTGITINAEVFYKRGEIFIGGNLVLVNSQIVNNGLISVAGGVILNGTSTITGTGTII